MIFICCVIFGAAKCHCVHSLNATWRIILSYWLYSASHPCNCTVVSHSITYCTSNSLTVHVHTAVYFTVYVGKLDKLTKFGAVACWQYYSIYTVLDISLLYCNSVCNKVLYYSERYCTVYLSLWVSTLNNNSVGAVIHG